MAGAEAQKLTKEEKTDDEEESGIIADDERDESFDIPIPLSDNTADDPIFAAIPMISPIVPLQFDINSPAELVPQNSVPKSTEKIESALRNAAELENENENDVKPCHGMQHEFETIHTFLDSISGLSKPRNEMCLSKETVVPENTGTAQYESLAALSPIANNQSHQLSEPEFDDLDIDIDIDIDIEVGADKGKLFLTADESMRSSVSLEVEHNGSEEADSSEIAEQTPTIMDLEEFRSMDVTDFLVHLPNLTNRKEGWWLKYLSDMNDANDE
jgi:hypothetical protein